jgi:4-amino-4-deoxy-L-arabinose transferase-like glycosyltransferase
MISEKQIRRTLWVLLLLSLVLRAIVAGVIEFGNDEVYYWTYAKFPDWSHFDHPPMVGWLIQVFTLNLKLESEFFIRLGSVIFGTISTYMMFLIGKRIKDSLTGLYAAFLFTSSIYCTIISGIFIMPDSPQVLFWLISLYLLIIALPDKNLTQSSRKYILIAGFTVGLALLSKYHSVFLIFGTFLYILFFNRKWFRTKELYIALIIIIILFLPVLIWNYHNSFISFTFHENRIDYVKPGIRWDYFRTEIGGEFFYNNPVNVILILFAFYSLIIRKKFLNKEYLWIILFISLPLALLFQSLSLYRSTLPHWTGPAYLGFILLAAAFLSGTSETSKPRKLIPVPVFISTLLIVLILAIGVVQINFGWINLSKFGMSDFSAQLYGWKQLGTKVDQVMKERESKNGTDKNSPIISYRWFPCANFDYYVASPAGRNVYALGTLERIHKYYWINNLRGTLRKGTNAYYIGLSDDFTDPKELYNYLFDSISSPDTVKIFRGKELLREAYVYRLLGLSKELCFGKRNYYKGVSPDQVRYWENMILSNPGWLELVKRKALEREVPWSEQLHEEASYMANQEIIP